MARGTVEESVAGRDPDVLFIREESELVTESLLLFSISSSVYALEARYVSHVGPAKAPLPVPTAPSFVRGVVHERGRIATVIDLAGVASGHPTDAVPDGGRLVMLEIDRLQIALIVERILGVYDVPRAEVRKLEARDDERGARMILGRFESPKGAALVLDGPGLIETLRAGP